LDERLSSCEYACKYFFLIGFGQLPFDGDFDRKEEFLAKKWRYGRKHQQKGGEFCS
jgi:hypothetical protein